MHLDKKPAISITLPVYNCEDHIAEAIESILNQTFTNFEFIIVNDASTDNTYKILEKYKNIDSRIRIITNKQNLKQTKSATIACQNSQGTYLARMDADDIALPKRLEKQYRFLEENPSYGIVGSWTDTIIENGNVVGQWKTSENNDVLIWDQLFGVGFAHSSVMMRRNLVEQVGYYQTIQSEDYDLWSKISQISKIANIPEVLQQKRVWGGQLALRVVQKNLECHLQIMKSNMEFLLQDRSIDPDLIDIIFSTINENQFNVETKIYKAGNALALIKIIYSSHISKVNLSSKDKKKIKVDLFQILYQLAIMKYSSSSLNGVFEFLKLLFRFPKLFIYRLFQNII